MMDVRYFGIPCSSIGGILSSHPWSSSTPTVHDEGLMASLARVCRNIDAEGRVYIWGRSRTSTCAQCSPSVPSRSQFHTMNRTVRIQRVTVISHFEVQGNYKSICGKTFTRQEIEWIDRAFAEADWSASQPSSPPLPRQDLPAQCHHDSPSHGAL